MSICLSHSKYVYFSISRHHSASHYMSIPVYLAINISISLSHSLFHCQLHCLSLCLLHVYHCFCLFLFSYHNPFSLFLGFSICQFQRLFVSHYISLFLFVSFLLHHNLFDHTLCLSISISISLSLSLLIHS